eukprot:c15653_g1_i1 orf=72-539(+)
MASSFRASCRAGRSILSQHLHRHGHGQHQEQQHLTAQSSSFLARFMSTGQAKLFVGGLSWQTEESQLKDAFSSFGEVTDARIVLDKETGVSKGFGFVSFASAKHADAAMKTMDGRDLNGKTLRVNFANDRQRGFGGFGSGGGAAYGDGGGYSGGG